MHRPHRRRRPRPAPSASASRGSHSFAKRRVHPCAPCVRIAAAHHVPAQERREKLAGSRARRPRPRAPRPSTHGLPPTMRDLLPHERAKLMCSTRQLGQLLGGTPHLIELSLASAKPAAPPAPTLAPPSRPCPPYSPPPAAPATPAAASRFLPRRRCCARGYASNTCRRRAGKLACFFGVGYRHLFERMLCCRRTCVMTNTQGNLE